MIHKAMMIPKKEQKKSNDNEDSWLRTKKIEPSAL